MKPPCELILALDLPDRTAALTFLDRIDGSIAWVKVGLQLFTRLGPDIVREVSDRGYHVFLDLKLHDIPNTVAGAIESIGALSVDLLTLHASGGGEMMAAARESRNRHSPGTRLLGVTVLTSLDQDALHSAGYSLPAAQLVSTLGTLACESGADGLVCSPEELALLRQSVGTQPILVSPGIRLKGEQHQDQKRVMDPEAAARLGADFIVVGRPLLSAGDPRSLARTIRSTLGSTSGQ